MTSRTIALAAGVLLVGSLHPAWAADKNGGSNGDGNGATAKLIADAVAEYDAGHFEEARALFRLAHDRAPTARTFRGIGMTSFELRDYVDATRALRSALRAPQRPLTEEQRHQVEALLARAETFVGRFSPRLKPADAELLVDGKPTAREADGALLLAFGHHRITMRCPSCTPTERDVEVEVLGGEQSDIELSLGGPGDSGSAASTATPQPAGTSLAVEQHASSGNDLTAPLWWSGAAVTAALGAVGSGIWWHNRSQELDSCQAAGEACKNESTLSDQRGVALGLTIGLGVAAITSGVVAAILWPHHDPTAAGPVAWLSGKGTVSCAIRF